MEPFSSDFSITSLMKEKYVACKINCHFPPLLCQLGTWYVNVKWNVTFFLISSCESLWFPGEKSVFSDERTFLDYHKCVVASYITSCLSIAKWVGVRKILNEMEWWTITAPTTFQIHPLKITRDEASLRAFVMTSCVINIICSTYY